VKRETEEPPLVTARDGLAQIEEGVLPELAVDQEADPPDLLDDEEAGAVASGG
jgi:hypothetical protein